VDLHIHTPASSCYAQPDVTLLQILEQAELKELDIIALTDHNTVAGYARLMTEIEELDLLKRLNRLRPQEKQRLRRYQELVAKVLVLPGFEFTATLGFHILGIFSEQTSVRELEHILLDLHVPPEKLDKGSTEVGATVDVLSAYRIIAEAGGLVIAAHANSTHGVALQGFDFGGQTKVAYTQDPNLHALEVTDLESTKRRSTANFYSGSKPEYPRRMHCIQASDAHRLERDPQDKAALGIGDRVTEILLPELSFESLKEVFLSDDFSRTRPYRPAQEPFDHVEEARKRGANIVQSFHPRMSRQGGRLHKLIRDVGAFANTNGGTIYVGASDAPKEPPVGIDDPEEAISTLRAEIHRKIIPPIDVAISVQRSKGKNVIRIVVPRGTDLPYVMDNGHIYVRQESETSLAVREEIIQLVKRPTEAEVSAEAEASAEVEGGEQPEAALGQVPPPKTGVEVVESVERKGTLYHTVRDLRNGNVVSNVTRSSARRLWRYAIVEREENPPDESGITWHNDIGLVKRYRRNGRTRYDLAQRDADGKLHVYYGVSEEGIHGTWRTFLEGD
jgi:hypothetical protein